MFMNFIDTFVISDVTERPYLTDSVDSDQMRYEQSLRSVIAEKNIPYPGKPASSMEGWEYYYSYGNSYVDRSTFYSILTYVAFDACTVVKAEMACQRTFVLWTYAAVSVWCNGKLVCETDTPVYKPIIRKEFVIDLVAGENEIYLRLQNLGVRDTKNLFGLELSDPSSLQISVPEGEYSSKYLEATTWLNALSLVKDTLQFPTTRTDIEIGYDLHSPDFATVASRYSWFPIAASTSFVVGNESPYFLVRIRIGGQYLSRRFEIAERISPEYSDVKDFAGNFKRMLGVIAAADGLSRGDKFGFYIQNILARKALGTSHPRDREYFLTTLQQIEDRYDCSDFLISGVIRYMKNYELDAELQARIDEVLLNYRYWMTMKGSDAMCFWSENHSLLFYSCAMIVGSMYSDAYFPRAEMTGSELSAFGKRLTMEWLDDVEELGFEEFLSTVYMNVTFACLLNIVDYAEKDISDRAAKVTDRMLKELSLHTFDGSIIAPMGRVYRGIINPSKQGAQSLMNLVNPLVPTSFGEGWLSYFATSSYQIPSGLVDLMEKPVSSVSSTGNALVVLEKTADYCLTSVQSPRLDGHARWKNITLEENTSQYENTHLYTKSFNERFHGTTFFEPGVFGYQQHVWSAAISCEALVFANNPGASCDSSSMRPGYWYGNGILPALKQDGRVLGAIYEIPDSYPLHFTHAFIPISKFEEVIRDGDWFFLRQESGFMALWCNTKLEAYDDELSRCEYRAYGQHTAYVCLVGSVEKDASFSSFIASAKARAPQYDAASQTLFVDGNGFVKFEQSNDKTQYV